MRHSLNHIDFEIATGWAQLFSTQMELEDIQFNTQLFVRAEIKRLQVQIKYKAKYLTTSKEDVDEK